MAYTNGAQQRRDLTRDRPKNSHSLARPWPLLTGSAVLFALFLMGGLVAWASPPPAGVAPVVVPAGGFAIDGDLVANTPTANAGDWLGSTNGTGGGVLSQAGAPLNSTTTFHFIDAYSSSSDLIFAGGLKWTDDPNVWQWTTGKACQKRISITVCSISARTPMATRGRLSRRIEPARAASPI